VDPALRIRITEAIESALTGGPTIAVATVVTPGDPPLLEPGAKLLVGRGDTVLGTVEVDGEPGAFTETVVAAAREAMVAFPRINVETLYLGGDAQAVTRRSEASPGDAEVMLQIFESPGKLVIVGAGHVGLALAQIGELLDFDITVIDDRDTFANRERFPMAERIIVEEPQSALSQVELDDQTYVVLVSRGHRLDEEALRATVGRGGAYVGMIGSRRRTGTVLRHLAEEGFDVRDLDEVSTPIGLDIGAETPEEIAVSIFAEITMLRRGGTGRRMKLDRGSLLSGDGDAAGEISPASGRA
jgi:xanthine dehydrogenase accessory factor